MTQILEIVGSMASVVGIPLTLYIYLRTWRNAYEHAREQISRTLSYQLGEGRRLSVFEVMAVIESVTRAVRVPQDRIGFDEVVDDLVTDTMSNPMLDSSRKRDIIDNLRDVHGTGESWQVVCKYGFSLLDLLRLAEERRLDLDDQDKHVLNAVAHIEPAIQVRGHAPDFVVLFGGFAVFLGLLGIVLLTSFPDNAVVRLYFWPFRPRSLAVSLIQGLVIAVGAWLLAKGADSFLGRHRTIRSSKSKEKL